MEQAELMQQQLQQASCHGCSNSHDELIDGSQMNQSSYGGNGLQWVKQQPEGAIDGPLFFTLCCLDDQLM